MGKKSFKVKNSLVLEKTNRQSDTVQGEIYYDSAYGSICIKGDYWSYLETSLSMNYQPDIISTGVNGMAAVPIVKIVGSPSNSFNLHGFDRGNTGKVIYIYNSTDQTMIVKNQSLTETNPNCRITTPTGADIKVTSKSTLVIFHDGINYIALQTGGGAGGGTSFDQIQPSHGFTLLTPIYHDGTQWQKAQANASNTLATYVVTATSTNAFTATKFGVVQSPGHGLTVGEFYFTSASSVGSVTSTEPLFGYSNPVLYVQDSSTIHIMCYRPSAIGDGNVSDSEVSSIAMFPTNLEPSGFLYCDGRPISRTTYADLFNKIGVMYGQGDGSSTFNIPDFRGVFLRGGVEIQSQTFATTAVNITTNVITLSNHKFRHSGFKVRFSSSGTLPSGLSLGTDYYAIYIDDNNFKVATTLANALSNTAISLVSQGSGTHTVTQYIDADSATRSALMLGGNSGASFGAFEDEGLGTHNHTVNDPGHTHGLRVITNTSGSQNGYYLNAPSTTTTSTSSATTGITINPNSGANETRPKNVSIGYFIRYSPKGAIKGDTQYMEVFALNVQGAVAAANGIAFFRSPRNISLQKVVVQLFEKGSASGTLTIDVKKNSTPNSVGMTSILSSTPSLVMSSSSDYSTSNGVMSVTNIAEGEWLRLDLTSVPTNMGNFYISIYGV